MKRRGKTFGCIRRQPGGTASRRRFGCLLAVVPKESSPSAGRYAPSLGLLQWHCWLAKPERAVRCGLPWFRGEDGHVPCNAALQHKPLAFGARLRHMSSHRRMGRAIRLSPRVETGCVCFPFSGCRQSGEQAPRHEAGGHDSAAARARARRLVVSSIEICARVAPRAACICGLRAAERRIF